MAKFVRESSGLVRSLSTLDVFNMNFSFMGPAAGILYPLAIAFALQGSNWILAAILGGLMTLPISFMYFYLSKEMPLTGGDYIYISRFLGPRWGFVEAFGNLAFFILGIPILAMFEVTLVIVPVLQIIGYVYNLPYLISVANSLETPLNLFALTAVLIIIAVLINLLKVKNMARIINILTFLQFIGTIAITISLSMVSHAEYLSYLSSIKAVNITAISGNKIIGLNPLSTLVLTGLIITSVYLYSSASIWVNGEVKKSRNAFLFGILGSFGVAVLFTVLLVFVIVRTIGANIFTYVEVNGWNLPFAPSSMLSFAIIPSLKNPFLLFTIIIGALTWDILYLIINVTIPSRVLFAMSFDRAMPTSFSTVKNGVPYIAILTIGALAILFDYLEIVVGLTISEIVDLIIYVVYQYMLTTIAAIRIGKKYGEPELLISSVLSFASLAITVGSIFYYSVVSPVFFSQIYYGSAIVNIGVLISIAVISLVAFELVKHYRLKKEGINIAYNYKELPPE